MEARNPEPTMRHTYTNLSIAFRHPRLFNALMRRRGLL